MTSLDRAPQAAFPRSAALQDRLADVIPGGAHTYARGEDQYPEAMAPTIVRGLGARVWDADGNTLIEYGMGLRAVTLGHGYRPVVEAVCAAAASGTCFTRPTRLELEAAEDLLALVPGADMVKFAKNGSDVTTAAVKLARAATGRQTVAACDQPFFSVDDWFVGTTPMSAGVDDSARTHTVRFRYNDLSSLATVLEDRTVACVILEAATAAAEPEPGFLEGVRTLCDTYGTVLIFDEIITGFRWSRHGAQGTYGVAPDLSCWGKAMGNGFAVSALAGRRDLMELGGLRTTRDRVFLLSTTHGPEATGLAAFRAVVRAYADDAPVRAMEHAGHRLAQGFRDAVSDAGLNGYVSLSGRPSCLTFTTRGPDGMPSQEFRTLFLQELLARGVLGQSFVTSAAHSDGLIDRTVEACTGALAVYRKALHQGGVSGALRGRPVAPAIRRSADPRRRLDRQTNTPHIH